MQYRPIGASGVQASKFALGAMSLGAFGTHDRSECTTIVQRAVDAGINVIDPPTSTPMGNRRSSSGAHSAGAAARCSWRASASGP